MTEDNIAKDYVPTNHLPDAEGRAVLNNLWDLYFNIDHDLETNKKRRANSRERHYAVAALKAALIKAAVPFEYFYQFNAWLSSNGCEPFTNYHPDYSVSELMHSMRRISQQMETIEQHMRDDNAIRRDIVTELIGIGRTLKALQIPEAAE